MRAWLRQLRAAQWAMVVVALVALVVAAAKLVDEAGGPGWVFYTLLAVGVALGIVLVGLRFSEVSAGPREEQRGREAHAASRLEAPARSVRGPEQTGDFFAGRDLVLREIVAWLDDPSPEHALWVVTGDAGSGKSAVLGRVVGLADASRRGAFALADRAEGTVPLVGAVSAAVVVMPGMTARQVEEELALAIGIRLVAREELAAVLSRRSDRRMFVVDGLDEAGEEAFAIAQLLADLAARGATAGVRVLVGTRRGGSSQRLLNALGEHRRDLDLDGEFLEAGDVREVVEMRLRCDPRAPQAYRDDAALTGQVVTEVAARAGSSFLYAAWTARGLAASPEPIDLERQGWEHDLPHDARDALARYIGRNGSTADTERSYAGLTALAYARGEGLPEDLWPAVARAVAGGRFDDGDIAALLAGPVRDLVVRRSGADGVTWRAFHEELIALLKDRGDPPVEVESRVVSALLDRVPTAVSGQRAWDQAPQYVLAHLASHAATARRLDELLADSGFVLAAGAESLLLALTAARSAGGAALRRTYQHAYPAIRQTREPGERAAYLRLSALQCGVPDVAGAVAAAPPWRWEPAWAHTQPTAAHHVAGRHDGHVYCVALGQLDGRPVVVSGGSDEVVRVWEPGTGAPIGQPMRGHTHFVWALVTGQLEGRPVVASGGSDGTVRMWELGTGAPIGEPLRGHLGPVMGVAVTELNGRPVIVSGGYDRTVRVWALDDGAPIGEPLHEQQPMMALAAGASDAGSFVVSGGYGGTVDVRELGTGARFGEPTRAHEGWVRALTVAEVDGRRVIVSGGDDGTIRICNLATGAPIGEPLRGHGKSVLALTVGDLGGRRVIVSGGSDGTLRVWDIASGDPIGEPLRGHEQAVRAVKLAVLDGRSVVVSGGDDGAVRVWDVGAAAPTSSPVGGHEQTIMAVAAGESAGRAIVVSGSYDRTVRRWALDTGAPIGQPLRGHVKSVVAIAVCDFDGRSVIVSGGYDGTLRRWDLDSGAPVGDPLRSHQEAVLAVAAGVHAGRAVIVSAGWDATVRRWELGTGEPIGNPLRGHGDTVMAVALGGIQGRPVVVSGGKDGTVRVWELAKDDPFGDALREHEQPVTAVAVGVLDGRPAIVSGGEDGTVRVCELASGAPIGEPLHAHQESVTAVAVGVLDGRPVIVSGSYDRTVCVWRKGRLLSRVHLVSPVRGLALHGSATVIASGVGLTALNWALDA